MFTCATSSRPFGRTLSITLIAAMAALVAAVPLSAATVHVDAEAGDDSAAGDKSAPLKTLEAALGKAAAGDTIVLASGDYGGIVRRGGPGKDLFTDWVTLRTAEGAKASIQRLQFGVRAGHFAGENSRGTYDIYLRVKGVAIRDGVYVFGGRHLDLADCRIQREGPYDEWDKAIALQKEDPAKVEEVYGKSMVAFMEASAVSFGAGQDLSIRNSEITHCGTGLGLSSGHGVRALGNHIHDIKHDGIRCVGLKGALSEGNHIHRLDDGVDDGDPWGKGWNRHCDGIHIFIAGPGGPGSQNRDLIFRNNRIYDCESQGAQFNNYYRHPEVRNENILLENNIFGPTRANAFNEADPVDGLIFRHNTFVHVPGGRTFGRITANNTTLRISGKASDVEVYNNILTNAIGKLPGWFVDYNVIYGPRAERAIPGRHEVIAEDVLFADPEAFDGKLRPESPAVNAGTRRFAPSALYATDLYGTERDARPDCGAFELPGQSPQAEPDLPEIVEPVTTYIENFVDGDCTTIDPWLGGENRMGLSWTPVGDGGRWFVERYEDTNTLSPPRNTKPQWLITEQGHGWVDIEVTAHPRNAYLKEGSGVMLLARPDTQGYLWDLAAGRLVRRMIVDGEMTETELAASGDIRLPRRFGKPYRLSVRHTDEGIELTCDAKADGEVEVSATDPDKAARERFAAGRVALYNNSHNGSHRTNWQRVEVNVRERQNAGE